MSTIGGDEPNAVTIDGEDVQEITMDGDLVWKAVQVVDNFEDGNHNGWTVPGSTGSDSIVSPGLNGTDYDWQLENFREAHLAGADSIDGGPRPGDEFEFWIKVTGISGPVINRFQFAADGVDDGDMYRIEFETNTGDNEFSLEKYSGGSQESIDVSSGSVNENQEYRCLVDWNVNGAEIGAQFFYPNGNAASTRMVISDDSTGEWGQPGISLFNNENSYCVFGEINVL